MPAKPEMSRMQLHREREKYKVWRAHQRSLAERYAREEAAAKNRRMDLFKERNSDGSMTSKRESPTQIEERVARALRYNDWAWECYVNAERESPPVEFGPGYKPLGSKLPLSVLAGRKQRKAVTA